MQQNLELKKYISRSFTIERSLKCGITVMEMMFLKIILKCLGKISCKRNSRATTQIAFVSTRDL